ncbi:MAG TPA: calcium-binding protein [Steroidobacteraceae bacterium]|nr:calcium-binding protein [Steroidobacteraceae bacterium]
MVRGTLIGGLGADTYQYSAGGGSDTIDNSSTDSLIDRLQFLNLASNQISFSRSGNNLVMTRIGVATDKVTVTNWFTASGNRLDFVNFTNGEVTASEIDTLVNGGGGSFAMGAPSSMMTTGTAKTAPDGVVWRPIKSYVLNAEEMDQMTLGGKSWATEQAQMQVRPIKHLANDEIIVGVRRLVDAMSSFGANVVTDSESNSANDAFARNVLEHLAAHQEIVRGNHAFQKGYTVLAE